MQHNLLINIGNLCRQGYSKVSKESFVDSLKVCVDNLSINEEVLAYLIPKGRPLDCEGLLWDYKVKFPILKESPTQKEKEDHKICIAEMVKDAVSFYNSFGGYIIFGVKDKGKNRVVGINDTFDCASFNKTLNSYIEANIECLYNNITIKIDTGEDVTVGVLLIPRRPPGTTPVKLKKKGPQKPNNKLTFDAQVYVRVRDECRPAVNTTEDWSFLYSNRLPPESMPLQTSKNIISQLPARDTDLINFVGRNEQLASLRQWCGDMRSPLRLITGIGGLGKTALAYHFSEEVIKTGAGEVEAVIWLTAKQQTFSALRGKMVATSRVDFSDLSSLINAILKVLQFTPPMSEDDLDIDELGDHLVEGLSIIPSLVIVDDLDTLSPEEQRETVAALQSYVLRTVGRDLPPSRVLMTSRIDQGLPPTSIVKIRGLDKEDFKEHLEDLCETFEVPMFHGTSFEEIFISSSGSPLFAASIVRLIKLGENRKSVLEAWSGRDGEEVRLFAFKRELERLTSIQGRILYAAMLLGNTTLQDISDVISLSSRVVRDNISELQAYHLISTITDDQENSSIVVPNELLSIIDIVKKQIGILSKSVEEAVARENEKNKSQEKNIGSGIRSISRLWANNKEDEALIVAKKLKEKYQENGDVASILGSCYLRISPPNFKDADFELSRATRLCCVRAELFSNLVRAKEGLEDWGGLRDIARSRFFTGPTTDNALKAHIKANKKLMNIARNRGDYRMVSDLALEIVERITSKIRSARLAASYFEDLAAEVLFFSSQYVEALNAQYPRMGDRLRIFEGICRLASMDIVYQNLLERGILALQQWWSDVETRPVKDIAACKLLIKMLGKLKSLEKKIVNFKHSPEFMIRIEECHRDLEYRGASLQSGIGY